ncbi:hypothetical protein [Ruficoccus sp. ZRK36]|uniref:hypothetical protein n=1 Tax=Ruficoccus sp. ZRK36 TaxID=2866311 RepID=UPI001C73652B|nr:hypothetical protein [Ruficoccus sp. ZRK36]QYY36713.1 hypothetical protein K0V07_04375 [Ruficoccus sp. ZRK36]
MESLLAENCSASTWQPSGYDRELYLDNCERIVRMAVEWVNKEGAVIDPVTGEEWNQTTSRFVSSAAILISFGRCQEYLDIVCRSMAYCCRRLRDGTARDMSPDFWMRELMTADQCLEGIAPPDLQAAWRDDLRAVDGERSYQCVDPAHGEKLKELHNWVVYSSAGEGMRELAGLGPSDDRFLWGADFFNVYMEPQLEHMTEYGMYRDPGDPITYDITTRLQFCASLAYGLDTPLRPTLEELERRGALTALLFTSTDGYAPYGGRSSQFQFQEAILSAIFELEAQGYKDSNPRLAGAFKAQAHRCGRVTQRWLMEMTPPRHLKNGFDPDTRHGIDGYGQYSVYSLLCSSFYGLAALFADESISESVPPSGHSGYVFELKDAFHKIFASCGDTYVEIDTSADPHYDATGIGRLLFAGTPVEMVLGMPFSAHPQYSFASGEKATDEPAALAPKWTTETGTLSLASLGTPDLTYELEILTESPEAVAFAIHYQHAPSASQVDETLTLRPGALDVVASVTVNHTSTEHLTYMIPIIVTDGSSQSHVVLTDGLLSVEYLGFHWSVRWGPEQAKGSLSDQTVANRNGCYRLLELDFGKNAAGFSIINQ